MTVVTLVASVVGAVVVGVAAPASASVPVARFHGTGSDSKSMGENLKFTASGSWRFTADAPRSCVLTRNHQHFGYFTVEVFKGASGMKVVHSSTGNGVPHYSWRGSKGTYHFEVFTECSWKVTIRGARSGAPVAKTRIISNCSKQKIKPRRVVLTCGDGTTVATGLRYSRYGKSSAAARGTLRAVTCDPSCATGQEHSYKATFRFYRARTRHHHRVFTRVRATFAGASPYGAGRQSFRIG